jgi:Tol biopolymer transport system component
VSREIAGAYSPNAVSAGRKRKATTDWNQLYLVSLDGGTPEKLVENPHNEIAPDWWPDGKSIAFNEYPLPGEKSEGIRGIGREKARPLSRSVRVMG